MKIKIIWIVFVLVLISFSCDNGEERVPAVNTGFKATRYDNQKRMDKEDG